MTSKDLKSWGRYPKYAQTPHASHWRGDLLSDITRLVAKHGSTLPFGNGRSYGDSCMAVSDNVLHTRSLDRFIAADWHDGTVIVEPGITIEELLSVAIPKGWFLPVTPGTKYVTIGGALANDVHGKNHHRSGTFGNHVKSFGLVRSDGPPIICSTKENSRLFTATIGGLGLTGVIEWVEMRLSPIQSSLMTVTTIRFNSLSEFFDLSSELDPLYDYTVAWVDCLARGASVGRGVYMAGNHSKTGGLNIHTKSKMTMPFTPPVSAINHLSLRLFNSIYFRVHKEGRYSSALSYDPFFYPLDRILDWNRLYGPRGFQQYQCVIPKRNAEPAVRELLSVIAATREGSFLAVMKTFGDIASPGLLSFPLHGISLSLDFPQHEYLNHKIFPYLDKIVREAGGRLYPAKDAHMSGEDFRKFYPNWEQIESLRDPVLSSRLWHRVTAQ